VVLGDLTATVRSVQLVCSTGSGETAQRALVRAFPDAFSVVALIAFAGVVTALLIGRPKQPASGTPPPSRRSGRTDAATHRCF